MLLGVSRFLRHLALFTLCFLAFGSLISASDSDPTAKTTAVQVSWEPIHITNGSPIVFKVVAPEPLKTLNGTWISHPVRFFSGDAKDTWYGFAGVDVEVPKGSYKLELLGTTTGGSRLEFQRTVVVGATSYPKITLNVPQRFVAPSSEEVQQIEQDRQIKSVAFAKGELYPEWSGNFAMPVEASASDSFGTARVFNGKVASVHRGTDFRVPSGTAVHAANDGQVVLAQPLFFEGGCVMIDHGEGLKTIYMHLSEIQVKAGEQVKKGQVIALSGGTGRATGPHLHMAVRWEGTYLDPTKLLKLPMPQYRGE